FYLSQLSVVARSHYWGLHVLNLSCLVNPSSSPTIQGLIYPGGGLFTQISRF
ncbi:hypothetical protein AMECASPLE_028790, partial [Ameca splendens]